jgi:hypothetical protein
MKKTSKILSIILAILMVMSIIPITASAETPTSGSWGNNVTWTFDESTGTLTFSGTGAMKSFVASYGVPWNGHIDSIESVIISEGVTTITPSAFYYHENIKNVSIADSVTEIGERAFFSCTGLTEVVIGKGVTVIGEFAFEKCSNLKSVTIYNAVEEICRYAFNVGSKLTDVYYFGTEAEWNAITKATILSRTGLENATIHFLGEETHECSYNAVVTPPTCTEQGYTTYTCECGDSYVADYVNATGHSFGNWTTEIAPTCTETGLEKRVCSACGETETNELSATGHNYDYDNGMLTRPTETEKGFYTYICKNDISHITTEEVESADYTEYNKVARKLEEYLSNSNITSEAKSYIMSECVNIMRNNAELYNFSSLTERRDLIASEQYIVDKATREFNEFFQVVDSVIANCELGNHDVRTYISNDNATCTVNGTKRGACYYCGSEVIVDDENNPALGHDIVVDNAIAPTCTGTGLTEGSHCSRCDGATTEQEVVPALGHSYNPVVTAPTCTEGGYTTYTCACGDSYVDDYVDELGHTEEIIPAVASTCTETGLTEGAKCSICGETLTEQKELPANGHSPANPVEENYVAPTCTENGNKDVVVYCSVCDEEISRETVTLDATGHADNDGDGYCDADNKLLDPTVECDHNCHKDGISGFFWKIANFFNKLFGLKKYCDCGVAHY